MPNKKSPKRTPKDHQEKEKLQIKRYMNSLEANQLYFLK